MSLARIFMECELKCDFKECKRMGAEELETEAIENFCGIFFRDKQRNGGQVGGSGVKRSF